MPIIDAHLHFSRLRMFQDTAEEISRLEYSAAGLAREYAAAGVTAGIAMGLTEQRPGGFPDFDSPNPMLLDLEADRPAFMACCPGINPMRLASGQKDAELAGIERVLAEPWVVGIKIYAGYYPYYVRDSIYDPVYDLAARYDLPVVIHTGVTYSSRGMLKYSHPLTVDELAVKRGKIRFVLAHLGDPWVMDAAAVIFKNPNVYADLSGLYVADGRRLAELQKEDLLLDRFRRAMQYTEDYSRFLFGSDWPLVPVGPYIELIKDLVPQSEHEKVFYGNAMGVYNRLKALLKRHIGE